jgi:hypothetical protein
MKGLRHLLRGLRGVSLSVVWRGDLGLVALETRLGDGEIERPINIKNWRTTWRIYNSSKNRS